MAAEITFTVTIRDPNPAAAAQAILGAPVAPVPVAPAPLASAPVAPSPVAPAPVAPAVRRPRVRHARNIAIPQPAARPASVTYRAIVAFSFLHVLEIISIAIIIIILLRL